MKVQEHAVIHEWIIADFMAPRAELSDLPNEIGIDGADDNYGDPYRPLDPTFHVISPLLVVVFTGDLRDAALEV